MPQKRAAAVPSRLTAPPSELAKAGIVYVPALRWKEGEISALEELAEFNRYGMLPLLMVDSQKERQQYARDPKVPDKPGPFIDYAAAEIQKLLKATQRAYIDTTLFDVANPNYDGLERFFSTIHAGMMHAIPVLRENISDACLEVIRRFTDERGVCIRLKVQDLKDPASVEALVAKLGVGQHSIDIIFDLFRLPGKLSIPVAAQRISKVLKMGKWRRSVLMGGSFVRTKREEAAFPFRAPRLEVEAYRKITAILSRKAPIFGDYGVVSPQAQPATKSGGSGHFPIIRYCTREAWYNWIANDEYEDYRKLTHECATFSEFMGARFSPGDDTIESIARGESLGLGNPEIWVRTDTSHHLVYTARQAAGLLPTPEPIDRGECRFPKHIA